MSNSPRVIIENIWNGYESDFIPYDDISDSDTLIDFIKSQAILHPEDQDVEGLLTSIEKLRSISDDFKNNHQNKSRYFQDIDSFIDNDLPKIKMCVEPIEAFADIIIRLKDLAEKL